MDITKKDGPFIESPLSTGAIMRNLMIALFPVIIFWCYQHDSLNPLIYALIGGTISFLSEFLFQITLGKRRNKRVIFYDFKHNHSFIPGLFVGILLPHNAELYLVLIGAFLATIFGKMIFGGFGNNKFNPALVGIVLLTAIFGGLYNESSDIYNVSAQAIDTTLGIGALVCLCSFLFLAFTRTIKWQIPLYYVGTVFVLATILGLINDNLWYSLVHILSGGLIFGAVFMATDPVTTPITEAGQILGGILLGILTFIFRFTDLYQEAVILSILCMNILVLILDHIGYLMNDNKKSTP